MIRVPVEDFAPSRSQRRVLRRMERFLRGSESPQPDADARSTASAASSADADAAAAPSSTPTPTPTPCIPAQLRGPIEAALEAATRAVVARWLSDDDEGAAVAASGALHAPLRLCPRPDLGDVCSASALRALALLRRCGIDDASCTAAGIAQAIVDAMLAIGLPASVQQATAAAADCGMVNLRLAEPLSVPAAVRGSAPRSRPEPAPAPDPSPRPNAHTAPVTRRLSVDVRPATFTLEAFELYQRYQVAVHHDTEGSHSVSGYRRFLVDGPLVPEALQRPDGTTVRMGQLHMSFRIDGAVRPGSRRPRAAGCPF